MINIESERRRPAGGSRVDPEWLVEILLYEYFLDYGASAAKSRATNLMFRVSNIEYSLN